MIQITYLKIIDEEENVVEPTSLEEEKQIAEKLIDSLEGDDLRGQVMVCDTKRDCEIFIRF